MRRILITAVIISLFFLVPTMAHSLHVEQTNGPSAGAIKFGMAFSQSNLDVIYVDRYKSIDGGRTWTELDLPEGAVNNIDVDPLNSDRAYLAAANVMYKTTDGGTSWQNLGTLGSDDSVISSLAIDPSDRNKIYAGTTHGKLYISSDEGKTWEGISNKLNANSPISRIAFNSHNSNEIYISTGSWYWSSLTSRPKTGEGLFKSTDRGKTFVKLENEFSQYLVQDVDVVGETVYVATNHNPDKPNEFYSIYKSSDGGATWENILDKRTSFFFFDALTHVAVNPSDENHIIVSISGGPDPEGEVTFALSYDGGKNWKLITTKESEPIQYTHELEILGDGRAYAMDYYRPFLRSDDNGESWIWSSDGIRRSRIHSLEIHPTNRNVVFAGTTDGALHKSYDGGKTWERISTKLSATYISSIEFYPDDSSKFYFGVSGPFDSTTGRYFGAPGFDTGLYSTGDSGKTLSKFTNLEHPHGDEGTQLEIYDILVYPSNPDLILVATASEGVYRSEDAGKTWKEANGGIPQDGFYWNLNLEPEGNTPREECEETYERYKQGEKRTSGCFYYATRTSMNLFANPHTEGEVWYTTLNGIFVSNDFGKTWSWLSDDLRNIHTHFMAFDPVDSDVIYVGTHQGAIDFGGKVVDSSKGLLISRDGGATWVQVNDGPGEGNDIRAIAVSHKNPDFVAVGTQGPFYISEDKGKTWEKVDLESVEGVDEIRIDTTAKIIYLGTGTSGVWRGIIDYTSSDPAVIDITGISSPKTVKSGETFDVIVSVDNVGGKSGTLPIDLKIGDIQMEKTASLQSADQMQARFSLQLEAGIHDIIVNGKNYGRVSVEVEELPEEKVDRQKEELPQKSVDNSMEDSEKESQENFFEMLMRAISSFFNSLFGGEQNTNSTQETEIK